MTKKVARLSVMCALALGLAACAPTSNDEVVVPPTMAMTPQVVAPAAGNDSQAAALETFVAAGQTQIPAIMDSAPGIYSQVTISAVPPDTVEFAYYFAQAVDPADAVPHFDSMVPTFQTAGDTDLFPGMANAGVKPTQKVTYTYYNADGSQLWTHTFEPS